ncbi:uncharacterized protein LOC144631273 [Oculina patagonica]
MALKEEKQIDLATCSTELVTSIRLWSVKRRETVQTLRDLADELLGHHKNVHIAKVSGSSASIGGFVLLATGFGLAPVTLGTSLILSAVGGAICAGGGATVAGSSIVQTKIFKTKLATAQEIIDTDRKAQEPVQELLEGLCREVSKESFGSLKNHLACNLSVALLVKNLVDVSNGVNITGVSVATTIASEGADGLLRTIGIAGNTVRIGIFAVSVALLPLDIYTMVKSLTEIDSVRKGKKDNEPEAVKKLRDLADNLEMEMNEMLHAVDEFQQQQK